MLNITKGEFIGLIEKVLGRIEGPESDPIVIRQKARAIYREAMPCMHGKIDRFILYGYTVLLDQYVDCDRLSDPDTSRQIPFLLPVRSLRLFLDQVALAQGLSVEQAMRVAGAVLNQAGSARSRYGRRD